MNKIMFIAKQFAITSLLILLFCVIGHTAVYDSYYSTKVTKSQLQERLKEISSDVSMQYTDEVHELVHTYIRAGRRSSEKLLGRTKIFFPIFDLHMEQYVNLPEEIKNLSIIESSLNVHAVSRSGAVGLWQFISSTARNHGLQVNTAVDERKDPYLSTRAAFDYLKKLHGDFDDWTLAMAAYNCGPGNVRKAIRKSRSTNFWVLEKYLPKETRRYIPKLIAATYLMSYYDHHSLKPTIRTPKFERTAIARIYNYTRFADISREIGISVEQIKELNPAFIGDYIPRSQRGYLLTLPEKEMFFYLTNNGLSNDLEFTLSNPKESFERTIIFSGFQMRKAELEMMNRMPALVSLVKNPFHDNLKTKVVLESEEDVAEQGVYEYHELKFGESILDLVGRQSNTTLEELIELNSLDPNNPPKPGDLIRIKKH